MTYTPGPWHVDGRVVRAAAARPVVQGIVADRYREANLRLISLAPELVASLEAVVGWLEGTEAFETSHGAHSDAVEARKLLVRARGEDATAPR